jgi:hypothetical protein
LTGGNPARDEQDPGSAGRGLMSGIEARLAGVLVSALHEAFARDAARLDAEREQFDAERRRADAALRLEMARQEADRQLAQLRAIVAINIVVWLASLLVLVVHPVSGGVPTVLLGTAWGVLTAAVACAFIAYSRVSEGASLSALAGESQAVQLRPRVLNAASWLTVGGLGFAAASVIALVAA